MGLSAQLWTFTLEDRLRIAWRRTADVKQDDKASYLSCLCALHAENLFLLQVILMGLSRGGFLAKMVSALFLVEASMIFRLAPHCWLSIWTSTDTTWYANHHPLLAWASIIVHQILLYPGATIRTTSTYLYCFDPVAMLGLWPIIRATVLNSTPAQPVFKVGNREYECDEYPNYLKRTLIILMKDEERTLYSPSLFHRAQVVYPDTQGPPSPVDTTNLDQVCPVLPYVFPYLISCRYGSTGAPGLMGSLWVTVDRKCGHIDYLVVKTHFR